MIRLRMIFALILLGFATREGVAAASAASSGGIAPQTNAASAAHGAAGLAKPSGTNAAPNAKKPKAHAKLIGDDTLPIAAPPPPYNGPFPRTLDSYGDEGSEDVLTVIAHRAFAEPFNLIATSIFLLAIIHTFLAPKIQAWSASLQEEREWRLLHRYGNDASIPSHLRQSVPAAFLHFFGEVEVVFGLWCVPLAVAMVIAKGENVARVYFDQDVSYIEPLFVVVIMAIAASRPIVQAATRMLGLVADKSPARWWLVLLTIGPLLGSFITEPAAMTICALLLGREFFRRGPSATFMYATLGLLFVNVSVGGVLTSFAAPPVLIVAAKWNWTTLYMLQHFGLRALGGILVANGVYFLVFRKEFKRMGEDWGAISLEEYTDLEPVPAWVTVVHVLFLAWTVAVAHEPALFIGGFLFFLGFATATAPYQEEINLRPPLLVGFFLAGLVIHGGLQGWWLQPLLNRLTEYPLLLGSAVLTAFNDNASITYLATLAPNLGETLKIAVVSGAVAGGGLTVIANAPNPAGLSLLRRYFPDGDIAPLKLLLAALFPTLVMLGLFALPR
jgi:hypothetical protein